MKRLLLALTLILRSQSEATQERAALTNQPFFPTAEVWGLDRPPLAAAASADPKARGPEIASGPIAPAGGQPLGALSGRIIYTSAGHGWAWTGSTWALGRPLLNSMNEDYGNLDQMTMFAFY